MENLMNELKKFIVGVVRDEVEYQVSTMSNDVLVDDVKQAVLSTLELDTSEMIEDKIYDLKEDIKEDVLIDVKDAIEWRIEQESRRAVESKMTNLMEDMRIVFRWEVE